MKKNTLICRSLSAGIIAAMALVLSCAKDSKSKNEELLPIVALAMVTEDARSYDALPLVPASLASTKDTSSSTSQSVINDVVPQGTTTNRLKLIYTPVRSSVLIGKELVKLAGQIITNIETLVARYPGLVTSGTAMAYTDNSDTAHPGHIAKVSSSATFGAGGYKVETWWNSTGSDSLRDGKKALELNYLKDSSGNIDGVLFFRYFPKEQPTNETLVRVEFKKAVSGTEITRTAYVYVQNYIDFRNNTGANAAFFINENAQGVVTVEGGYTVQGLVMPFQELNVAGTDWEDADKRVYLFNGAGSIASGKAVVNVVLPLQSQSAALDAVATPFEDAQAWSLGELFTDGLLYYLNGHSEVYGAFGTQTGLWFLNLISGGSLTTGSDQAALLAALNSIDTTLWGANAAQVVASLQIITGIKNPVYFQKNVFSIDLVGQDDTDGLTGAADYAQLQAALSTDFTKFTLADLFSLSISAGTSVVLISDHPVGITTWAGIDADVPSI
ncbi:MAG: hypothetical protein KA369_05450 [Spirochaetes bacterium]|nr:hypothetical protein [Spirochaetota bacterium]